MKKLFMGISAMFLFLAGTASAKSQWPEFNPVSERKFRSKVDDGFGGEWGFGYGNSTNSFSISRPFSGDGANQQGNQIEFRYVHRLGDPEDQYLYELYNDQLKFKERSLPVDAGLGVAFYGYLTALNKAGVNVEALIWLNPATGEITEMQFRGFLKGNELILSIPPRNFALYEDIVKKTVQFEVPYGIEDAMNAAWNKKYNLNERFDLQYGIYYQFYIKFPAPAKGEPDFLALPADK